MLDRLLGLETEYAIRYSGPGTRPSHRLVFEAIVDALSARLATQDGGRKSSRSQRFLENGGAIYYEYLPKAPDGGLIEASTPECRGPSQLLLYQKAQERMLLEALPDARAGLQRAGFTGELGLIKNCRDAEGNVYGAQENYEVNFSDGLALLIYRVGLVLLLPLVCVSGALTLAVSLTLVITYFALFIVIGLFLVLWAALIPRHADTLERLFGLETHDYIGGLMRAATAIGIVGTAPGMLAYALLFRLCCCRAIRRHGLAFLISRPIISGAGTLEYDSTAADPGSFGLSEKGPSIRRLVRMTSLPADRSVFDIGNLMKQLFCVMDLELQPLGQLFRRRQRLQLGLSDSNAAHTAEYLKVATTCLVLDMAEAGALADLPRVRRPVRGLHQLIADPELRATVMCSDGIERSALELQRMYLERAELFVAEADATSLEARELLRLWRATLDGLETQPASLFGRLDWVTKRALLADAEALEPAARKTIDLRYHELGEGYLARLEAEDLVPTLVEAREIVDAIREPPQDTPARRRSQLVRMFASEGVTATIGWDRVEVRHGFLRREVIRLDDYRR